MIEIRPTSVGKIGDNVDFAEIRQSEIDNFERPIAKEYVRRRQVIVANTKTVENVQNVFGLEQKFFSCNFLRGGQNRIALERHVKAVTFYTQSSRRNIVRFQLLQDKIFVHDDGHNGFAVLITGGGIKILQVAVEETYNGRSRIVGFLNNRVAVGVAQNFNL